jgi:acetate kinase
MSRQIGTSAVLALNCGSSSLKFAFFEVGDGRVEVLIDGEAEAIGTPRAKLSAQPSGRGAISQNGPLADHAEAARRIFDLLEQSIDTAPTAVGHRIVHGGPSIRHHCVIDADVLKTLDAARAFAPLHTPPALEVVRMARARFSGSPHIACLDTAFHLGLPDVARRLPIAAELQEAGVERYGFHGLSCESILRQLGPTPPDRLVIAHLGSGSSVTAVKSGRSIDTSMGLTPSGGVMMATRSGDLDPGLLIYLIRERNLDMDRLEVLVDRQSGLAGISGKSGDLRLLRTAPTDPDARLAIEMFAYSVRKHIAAMVAALGGLDLLVFTGGIGEHDGEIRRQICQGLSWLTAQGSTGVLPTLVLPACEEAQIARHTARLGVAQTRG